MVQSIMKVSDKNHSLTHSRSNSNDQKQQSWSTLNLLGVLQANRKIQNMERQNEASHLKGVTQTTTKTLVAYGNSHLACE